MDVSSQKLSIIQQLLLIEDELLLEVIKGILEDGLKGEKHSSKDFWDLLTKEQKAKIELSRVQHKMGKSIDHEEMMEGFRQKYKQ